MLELDKSGKFWWLNGETVMSWEITEKWEELINKAEYMSDQLAAKTALLAECREVVKLVISTVDGVRDSEGTEYDELCAMIITKKQRAKAAALLPRLEAVMGGSDGR